MLSAPQSGERILSWAQQATKEINSNIVHNGIGIKVTRGPNGTNISTTGGTISPSVPRTKMPFDASLKERTGDSASIVLRVLIGDLFYGLGHSWTKVEQSNLNGDYWDVSLTVANETYVGIICEYDDEDGGTPPTSFYVGEIPAPEGGSESSETWVDSKGLCYYPLVKFVQGGDDYKGPYIFSVTVTEDNEEKTFYAIQSHHGDVFFGLGRGDYFIGEVRSGSHGRYAVNIVDGSGEGSSGETVWIDIVELANAATFPTGSRIIGHPIYSIMYGSGSISIGG